MRYLLNTNDCILWGSNVQKTAIIPPILQAMLSQMSSRPKGSSTPVTLFIVARSSRIRSISAWLIAHASIRCSRRVDTPISHILVIIEYSNSQVKTFFARFVRFFRPQNSSRLSRPAASPSPVSACCPVVVSYFFRRCYVPSKWRRGAIRRAWQTSFPAKRPQGYRQLGRLNFRTLLDFPGGRE